MRLFSFISAFASICLLISSCTAGVPYSGQHIDLGSVLLSGTVTDNAGNPIEHLKVTLDWNSGSYQDIKYTSSTGRFDANLKDSDNSDIITVSIVIEDIDGEDNGGLFSTHTERVTLIKNEITEPVLKLSYRLNRATASESSPQS